MSKIFFTSLMNYIDKCNEKLENFKKNAPDWEEMDEDQKIDLVAFETEISTLKWIRDKYYEYIDD